MGILNISYPVTGLADSVPQLLYVNTNDTLATVTTAGYLNTAIPIYGKIFSNQQMAIVYTTDQLSVLLQISVNYQTGVVTLSSSAEAGLITLPTVTNQLVVAANTAGGLNGSGVTRAFNAGGIDAGLSGTAGTVRSYPATASKGYLELAGVANTGNTAVTISNALHGQASVYTIPDIGAATGGILVSTTPLRTKIVAGAAAAGGAAAQSFSDAFCTSASIVVGNWVTQGTPASVLTIVPGNGSFIVTSSADAGVGTFSYIIAKA